MGLINDRSTWFSGYSRRPKGADLPHEPQGVIFCPAFGDLPINDAENVNAGNRDRIARRRNPQKLTLVCPYRRPAYGDAVAAGEHVIIPHLKIREGLVIEEHCISVAFPAWQLAWCRVVINEIFGKKCFTRFQVLLIPDVISVAPGDA